MARFRDQVEKLHRERAERPAPDPWIEGDPELRAAYRSLQLHWLAEYPEYRQLIRARLSEAAKRAEKHSKRIERQHRDVDYLGQEVEGCG